MSLIVLFTGLFIAGIGILVKAFPNLIAGYNTMSAERKALVDIVGLSNYLRNGFILIGGAMIIGYYGFKAIGSNALANITFMLVLFAGTFTLIIRAQQFDAGRNRKSTSLLYAVLGLVLLSAASLIGYGLIPSKLKIEKQSIQFSGMYGIILNLEEIESIHLKEEIPKILVRTNGFSFGNTHKGKFKLDEMGSCHLLVHSDQGPFLIVNRQQSISLIYNARDPDNTREVFNLIKSKSIE